MNENQRIMLGKVLDKGNSEIGVNLCIPLNELQKHVSVFGMPGEGKTTLMGFLSAQASNRGISVCIIEPVKGEYKEFRSEFRKPLRVFTIGDDIISPLCMNAFEPPKGVRLQKHLDTLRTVIRASFYMWDPLPQIFDRCLYNMFEKRGFDIGIDKGEEGRYYPTWDDLLSEIDSFPLQYSQRTNKEIKGALEARIFSLTQGSKGNAINSFKSYPSIKEILDYPNEKSDAKSPSVIELGEVDINEEKALIMGILFAKIRGCMETFGTTTSLRLLLIIEEAHRLFPAELSGHSNYTGSSRQAGIEKLCEMIAELRAYGVGVVIVDQSPSKVHPDTIRNTNLKIAFRVESGDDRSTLMNAMGLSKKQAAFLGNLEKFHAVCHMEGLKKAVMIKTQETGRKSITNEEINLIMKGQFREIGNYVSKNNSIRAVRPLLKNVELTSAVIKLLNSDRPDKIDWLIKIIVLQGLNGISVKKGILHQERREMAITALQLFLRDRVILDSKNLQKSNETLKLFVKEYDRRFR